jgi:SAM-dependent methyltransferase
VTAVTPGGRWATKASSLYDEAYARTYRAHDERLRGTRAYEQFVEWLTAVCRRFDHPIDVLDLGCGTGRYFSALAGARTVTGLDASAAMLAEAQRPFRGEDVTAKVELVCGDLVTADFPAQSFDLVYSIGVLAEHTPLTAEIVRRVQRWIRVGGRFAFTTVHPESPSVPRTFQRRVATSVLSILPAAPQHWLRRRLLADGLYADQHWIELVLAPAFRVESLTLMQSEAHLHCLCVARKVSDDVV